jgi:hypothetical protein
MGPLPGRNRGSRGGAAGVRGGAEPLTVEQVRRAEIGYADAIAIAGEFEVMNLSSEISWSWEIS